MTCPILWCVICIQVWKKLKYKDRMVALDVLRQYMKHFPNIRIEENIAVDYWQPLLKSMREKIISKGGKDSKAAMRKLFTQFAKR